MDSVHGERLPDEVYEALANLIAEAEDGAAVDLEDFLGDHDEHAPALRALWDEWSRTNEYLGRLGLDGSGEWADAVDERTASRLARLADPDRASSRYRVLGEVGRGGMARVLRCWDEDLRREVAMKVMLEETATGVATARLLEEAHISGRLDHPGIVAVHDLAVDERGEPYFTMTLVEGRDYSGILTEARSPDGEWTVTRAVGVLLKVCEAVAYAHSHGIVHRDLKPANVRVGRFGETYVMDWGLARSVSRGWEAEGDRGDGDPDLSPLLTAPGEVVGTPAYMAPEQAGGAAEEIGLATDVYAVGAMLYELLTGSAPYMDRASRTSRREVLERLRNESPVAIERAAGQAPPELAAVCRKAMARDVADRYPSMEALAADLRAFLEGRAVGAYRTGAWIELRLWVARNRGTASAIAAGILLAAIGLAATYWVRERGRERVQQMAELQILLDLEHEAEALWPPHPDRIADYRDWLRRAEDLAARVPGHRRALVALRSRALPYTDEERRDDTAVHPRGVELEGLRAQLDVLLAGWDELAVEADVSGDHSGSSDQRRARLEARIAEVERSVLARRTYRMPTRELQARHDILAQLAERHQRLIDQDPLVGTMASVRRRLRQALRLEERMNEVSWDEVRLAIAAHPAYGGLDLAPQVGLLPLGPDPRSGLWEFAHVLTGDVAERVDGRLVLGEETGLVLVLVPGGERTIGARRVADDVPAGDFEDPRSTRRGEGPVREVTLDPYFLSKYEMTQAQWRRMTGGNPSFRYPGFRSVRVAWTHPVEQVSWIECVDVLTRCGLVLPTEAQWEVAARAGTTTPYWTGREPEGLIGFENFDDTELEPDGAEHRVLHVDGWNAHAPVDSFEPNPWGFHHILANVSEYCRDVFMVDYRWPLCDGDGLRRAPEDHGLRTLRGGNYYVGPLAARVTYRTGADQRLDIPRSGTSGVRPARALDRR